MEVVGINSNEQDAIFSVVAAILHLGNVEFAKGSEPDSSEPKDNQSRFHLKTVAELLMCDEKALESSLVKRIMVTRDEKITKSLDAQAAAINRDALAKTVYSRLFDWLVDKINNSIGQDPDSNLLIGILDIYGFESFKTNSFEQFCINLTNEKLQQHFNQHVFKMEQEEYTKEQIDWSYIEFVDNQDILDLIEKKPGGIIALLDEACMFPRSTYETFAEKLYQTFKDHKRFSKPKLRRTDFTICHYAGDVTYQTELFLDKNKDYVVPEHQAVLSASRCSFISNLFPPPAEETSKSAKFSSIGTRFKQQLQSLLETLSATEPHYIRCVKPNNLLKPEIFENPNVLQQLRCGGVMEAIRISCAGFPTRKPFVEFVSRFRVLVPELMKGSYKEVAICKDIVEKVGLKGYQIGKTKVFLRAGQMAELDSHRTEVLSRSACTVQKNVRRYFSRKKYIMLRGSAIGIQTACRGQLARNLFECKRREAASLMIQKYARMFIARRDYRILWASAVSIQTPMRRMAARNEFKYRKETKAAILIQRHCRGHLSRLSYKRVQKAALAVQCVCRVTFAQNELRRHKLAAKEAGNLQKNVEELTEQLKMEKRLKLEMEEAKNQEISKLRSALEEMEEAKTQEISKLQSALKEMEEAKTQEISKLQSALKEMEEAKTQEISKRQEIEEAKTQEISKLQEMEEAKTQEISKLRSSLEEMRLRFEEVKQFPTDIGKTATVEEARTVENANLQSAEKIDEQMIANLQSAEKIDEQMIANLQSAERIVINPDDPEAINKLTDENAKLKALLTSLGKKLDEANKLSEERLKQGMEAESKVIELKTEMQRVNERNSDLETESQILRQQALLNSGGSRRMSGHLSSTPELSENGDQEDENVSPKELGTDPDRLLSRSQNERQRESVDILIRCVSGHIGFSEGKPIAAFTIYKCLLNWKSFEAEKTNVFDHLIQMIGSSIEDETNNSHIAYWMSNTSMLMFLLQQTLKATASSPLQASQPTSFLGRMFRSSFTASSLSIRGLDGIRLVEAKYPALLFKQQLTAYVEKIYGILRDNMKRNLLPILYSCVQAPQNENSSTSPWQSMTESLNRLLDILKGNYVFPFFIQNMFVQIFSYMDVLLFNSLLSKDKCTVKNGEYVKTGLGEIERWCGQATEEYVGSSWDDLKHVRQAVGFLVLQDKAKIKYDDLTTDLCPALSSQQLYRICTLCVDENNTQVVSQDVISRIKLLLEDSEEADSSNSYMLEDSLSSIPFSTDGLYTSLKDIDFTGVKTAEELNEYALFEFLKE
ncbi:myosin-7-like isoform X1 [Ipomoea triloba]|nr:myosin-7-like isoform X1 [Ipomoea triloba]